MNEPVLFNFGSHASELVCVAVGMNLLFPAAPSFYRRFLKNVETDPKKLYRQHFVVFKGDLTTEEAKRIGIKAKAVDDKRCAECGNWVWTTLELSAVVFGCLSLWCGLVDKIGGWSILLFLPVVSMIAWTWVCSWLCKRGLNRTIDEIRESVKNRSIEENVSQNDGFVQSFADKMLSETE